MAVTREAVAAAQLDGVLNLLKPPGMTSSDCVAVARRALGIKHIGHMGTLDPAAAGVLPLGVGKAAKLFDYAVHEPKTYIVEMALGVTTDTLDQQGAVLQRRPVTSVRGDIEALFPSFTGEIEQAPPAYSAIKVNGQPLYKSARRGEAVAARPRRVTIHAMEYLYESGERRHMLRVTCGGGAYIRSLVGDMGEALGCGAYCAYLLRTASCGLSIDDAHTMPELVGGTAALLPPDAVLAHLPVMAIKPTHMDALAVGRPIESHLSQGHYRAYDEYGFMGVMEADGQGQARMRVSFTRPR